MDFDLEKAGFPPLTVPCRWCLGTGIADGDDKCTDCWGMGVRDNRDAVITKFVEMVCCLEASLLAVQIPVLVCKGQIP